LDKPEKPEPKQAAPDPPRRLPLAKLLLADCEAHCSMPDEHESIKAGESHE